MARIHPLRKGRRPQPLGRQGLANHRWMGGGKLGLVLHQWGLVVGWACATAHGADTPLQGLLRPFEERMIVLSDTAFQAAEGAPANLKRGQRGAWEDRLLVETGLALLTLVCQGNRGRQRVWTSCHARLACTRAACKVLVQWHGFQPNASGFVPLSMAELRL
jgi:hypothetical protein